MLKIETDHLSVCLNVAVANDLETRIIAKLHYTGPTGPDQTKSAETRLRSGPCSGI